MQMQDSCVVLFDIPQWAGPGHPLPPPQAFVCTGLSPWAVSWAAPLPGPAAAPGQQQQQAGSVGATAVEAAAGPAAPPAALDVGGVVAELLAGPMPNVNSLEVPAFSEVGRYMQDCYLHCTWHSVQSDAGMRMGPSGM